MLDDVSLLEFNFCKKEKVSMNPSNVAVSMDVLANIQINTSVI